MEVRQLFVSSENRNTTLYPSGNAYTLHITEPIKDIARVELLYASVPNTIYNLSDVSSNVIKINDIEFSMPPGFYGASALATELTYTINTDTGITVQYLPAEGKFLFTNTASFANMNVLSTELASMLGLDANTNYNPTVGVTAALYNNSRYIGKNWVKSSRVANLAPNEGIFLDIHELRTMYNEDAKSLEPSGTYSGHNVSRTFGMIPMDVTAGAIKHFKKATDYDFAVYYTNPIRKLDRLQIQWVDRRGLKVNFNGLEDNSFMLRFYTLRKNL
jgi:hypothetical protein